MGRRCFSRWQIPRLRGRAKGFTSRFCRRANSQTMPLPQGIQVGQASWMFAGWYPDSTRFLAQLEVPAKPSGLWSVPILGGVPQKLETEVVAQGVGSAAVSPDGSNVVYLKVRANMAPGKYG